MMNTQVKPVTLIVYLGMCEEKYGLTPRYHWIWDYFGGQDIQRDFKAHSNIIFTNGDMDPWMAGGVNVPI